MKKILLSFLLLFMTTMSYAQIGYQVSLLNTATGEPRANEKVSCVIELKNSEGTVICSETRSATSNDFGVISLTVGNEKTFENMDWSKLPLYVSVTIGGKLIGQSQVLTVPVAEYAKKTGTLTYENIGEKKVVSYSYYWDEGHRTHKWTLNGRTAIYECEDYYGGWTASGILRIDGNAVFGYVESKDDGHGIYPFTGHYSPEDDTIYIFRYQN